MKYASKVIAVAEAEIGYLEKETKKDLDFKKANAGDENYTKYARDLDAIPGFYNAKKQGYAWCDIFVDWCFVQAFGEAIGKDLLCATGKVYGAGCGMSARYYKDRGQFHQSGPKPGDQIFFWNKAKSEVAHTGLVYKVDNTKVYTIEGNTSSASGVVANGGGVFKKSYDLAYSRIYGYGRPAYDEEIAKPKGDYTMEMRNLKKGCKGEDVKALQILLIGRNFSCGKYGADGDFGSATESAVRNYQKAKKLEVDGIAGKKTMSSLLGV